MKIAEIRELSTKELLERVDAEVAAYDQKKINHSISPMDNPSQIKQQRRLIARMKTELRQRELNNKNCHIAHPRHFPLVETTQQDGSVYSQPK